MDQKRIGVLEPDDDSDRKGLSNKEGLALVGALLKSKILKDHERAALETLKAEVEAADIAESVTDFFEEFFEDAETTKLIFESLGRYIAIRKGINPDPSYKPAKSPNPIKLGRTDCPLAVLRSHPDFPNTLSSELEGVWTGTNPAWPEETIKSILGTLEPPCHTDWKDFDHQRTEERDNLKACVIYVRPGPEPVPAQQ